MGHGSKVKPAVYCADSSVFRRGNQVIFRMYIVNAKTGKVMNGKDFSKVVVRIAGMPDLKTGFKPQGGNANAESPWLWSAAWLVPADYPARNVQVRRRRSAQDERQARQVRHLQPRDSRHRMVDHSVTRSHALDDERKHHA